MKNENGPIVAGTGHRPNKLGGYSDAVFSLLVRLATMALTAAKPKKVISGMALGWDMALAEAAVRLGIPFIAAIPHTNQAGKWPKKSQERYNKLLEKAERVEDISRGLPYHPSFMQARNVWMTDHCDLLLALWDGSSGGTGNCVEYAKRKKRRTKNFYATWEKMVTAEFATQPVEQDATPATGAPASSTKDDRVSSNARKTAIPAGDGSITVVRKGTATAPGAVRFYVGRGSPLGNPFTHKEGTTAAHQVESREAAVEAFAAHLQVKLDQKDEPIRKALNKIALAAMKGPVELECFCAPHACHADVLAQTVADRLNRPKAVPATRVPEGEHATA